MLPALSLARWFTSCEWIDTMHNPLFRATQSPPPLMSTSIDHQVMLS